MKNSKKNRSNFTNKKIFSSIVVPLFLLISAVVIVGSGCTTTDPDSTLSVVFSSPEDNATYYTDNINEAGESSGSDIVVIRAEVNSTVFGIASLSMRITNSAAEVVESINFTIGQDIDNYSISETFRTFVADDYRVTIISTNGLDDKKYYEFINFTYEDPSNGGATD